MAHIRPTISGKVPGSWTVIISVNRGSLIVDFQQGIVNFLYPTGKASTV